VKEFRARHAVVTEELMATLQDAYKGLAEKRFKAALPAGAGVGEAFAAVQAVHKPGGSTDEDAKRQMYFEMLRVAADAFAQAKAGDKADGLLDAFSDILAVDLDAKYGSSVNDQRIFRELTQFWEADFLQDMRALNVLPADVLTRVTEYIPEIVAYVQQIVAHGYGYESEGSVYFDVQAFHGRNGHSYAKLCPWSAGNAAFLEEGEGALGAKLTGKKDPRDFALWKASKVGEPFWASPWGAGRPGWHIECSAMAGAVIPGPIDVHSGGIDLAFPHHDNELAQAEAFLECGQWVNYFLHAGHVHIEGHKMSKSLKNFITIKEALGRYPARQLRIMVLQHLWSATVLYRDSSMLAAAAFDTMLGNYFATVQALIRQARPKTGDDDLSNNWAGGEASLLAALEEAQRAVHAALCDSFDTPAVLQAIAELIGRSNLYVKANGSPNPAILKLTAAYVTKIMTVLGVVGQEPAIGFSDDSSASDASSTVLPAILDAVGEYRDSVRNAAVSGAADKAALLALSDRLRADLSAHGVVFEDRPGQPTLVKLVDAAEAARLRDEAAQRDADKAARRLEALRLADEKEAAKRAKAAIKPEDLFRGNPAFSRFDEQGIPTHDADGLELSKNARKKAVKDFEAQRDLHLKYFPAAA
jgi:cysteinyl-tRNA synthetase